MKENRAYSEVDLLNHLPPLAPPEDLVAEVEYLALQELETSAEPSSRKAWSAQNAAHVSRYEHALHAALVVAYAWCAAQAGLRVLQRLIAG